MNVLVVVEKQNISEILHLKLPILALTKYIFTKAGGSGLSVSELGVCVCR